MLKWLCNISCYTRWFLGVISVTQIDIINWCYKFLQLGTWGYLVMWVEVCVASQLQIQFLALCNHLGMPRIMVVKVVVWLSMCIRWKLGAMGLTIHWNNGKRKCLSRQKQSKHVMDRKSNEQLHTYFCFVRQRRQFALRFERCSYSSELSSVLVLHL